MPWFCFQSHCFPRSYCFAEYTCLMQRYLVAFVCCLLVPAWRRVWGASFLGVRPLEPPQPHFCRFFQPVDRSSALVQPFSIPPLRDVPKCSSRAAPHFFESEVCFSCDLLSLISGHAAVEVAGQTSALLVFFLYHNPHVCTFKNVCW